MSMVSGTTLSWERITLTVGIHNISGCVDGAHSRWGEACPFKQTSRVAYPPHEQELVRAEHANMNVRERYVGTGGSSITKWQYVPGCDDRDVALPESDDPGWCNSQTNTRVAQPIPRHTHRDIAVAYNNASVSDAAHSAHGSWSVSHTIIAH